MKLKMLVLPCIGLMLTGGCIVLSNFSEGFSAVPYGGMYTTTYWFDNYEKDGVQYVDRYESVFPIGFFGDLNVMFWTAYGDYRNTSTYKRFLEWQKIPNKEKGRIINRSKKVDGNWVDVPIEK